MASTAEVPSLDDVGIRVGADQGAVGTDQPGEQRALVAILGHARHPAQQQGVMGDQQVGARLDRLIDRGGDGIDGEAHPPHRGARIAADEARCIPGFGAREGPQPIDRRQDLCEGGRHPTSLLPGRNRLVADVAHAMDGWPLPAD